MSEHIIVSNKSTFKNDVHLKKYTLDNGWSMLVCTVHLMFVVVCFSFNFCENGVQSVTEAAPSRSRSVCPIH